MRLRERLAKLPTRTLAKALRCPLDWVPEYEGMEPPCKRGESCDECIARMLEEQMLTERSEGVESAMHRLPTAVRTRVEEMMDDGE